MGPRDFKPGFRIELHDKEWASSPPPPAKAGW